MFLKKYGMIRHKGYSLTEKKHDRNAGTLNLKSKENAEQS